jgi:asparagine synthetase B (glutamine-hydrolysing)
MTYAKQVRTHRLDAPREAPHATTSSSRAIPVDDRRHGRPRLRAVGLFLHHALKLAKDTGCKVVVTGEANDEISCGHGEMIKIRQRYYAAVAAVLQAARAGHSRGRGARLRRARSARTLLRGRRAARVLLELRDRWPESKKAEILSPTPARHARRGTGRRRAARRRALAASEHGKRDYLNHIIYRMMQDYYFGT